MHKARDYIENNVANNIPWQCSSVIYAGERPVLFESSKSQPFAYNKTIDQENVIPSFNINLLDRENKFVNQLTLVSDNTSYYNRNGLPYSINNNSCSKPYKQKCSDNMFDNMVYSQPSVVTSVDGLGYPNRFKTQTDRRYGTNIVATNKPYWINEEYKMEHDRNYTNPTNSKGNIFSTSKQLRNVTNLKQQPLPIYDEEDIKDTKPYNIYKTPSTNIKYSKIYNTRDVDYTNIEDNIYNSKGDKGFLNTPDVIKYNLNIDVTKQPLKQIKSRFNTIDNDFNNNLPIYMQNIDRSILLEKAGKLQNNYRKDINEEIHPIDAMTNKLLNNAPNKLVEDAYYTYDENTHPLLSNQNKYTRQGRKEETSSHNRNSDKHKDNSRYNDGINEPSTGTKVGKTHKGESKAIIR